MKNFENLMQNATRMTLGALAALPMLASVGTAQDDVCAVVKIRLSQELVMARSVFTATFELDNQTASLLEDIEVEIRFDDLSGSDADHVFFLTDPTFTGFFGTGYPLSEPTWGWEFGSLLPGQTGESSWTIDPLAGAAPTVASVRYSVSGVLRYTKDGSPVVAAFFPQEIEVFPRPHLDLTYYLQDTVYGDNPFTPHVLEPIEPFSLGLRVVNTGIGRAEDVTLTSFEEVEIVENQNGLLVDFQILGVEFQGQPLAVQPSLDLGDLEPGESRAARWLMTSTLQGEFQNIEASFVHKNALGAESQSQISVRALPAVHAVEIRSPRTARVPDQIPGIDPSLYDGLPDYLIDEEAGLAWLDPLTQLPAEDVPSRLESSTGESFAVDPVRILDDEINGIPSMSDLSVDFDLRFRSAGWKYIRLSDLGANQFLLRQVTRTGPDGTFVWSVGGSGDVSNAWRTARPVDIAPDVGGPPETTQYLAHLFQYVPIGGEYHYELTYASQPLLALESDIDIISLIAGGTANFTIRPGATGLTGTPVYQLMGSLGGSAPGFSINGVLIPLIRDEYTDLCINQPFVPPLVNFRGTLDQGVASASLVIPPWPDQSLAGRALYHAFVLWEPGQGVFYASNVDTMYLAP